jgi:hypothetical protein
MNVLGVGSAQPDPRANLRAPSMKNVTAAQLLEL